MAREVRVLSQTFYMIGTHGSGFTRKEGKPQIVLLEEMLPDISK